MINNNKNNNGKMFNEKYNNRKGCNKNHNSETTTKVFGINKIAFSFLLFSLLSLFLLAGCVETQQPPSIPDEPKETITEFESSQELKKFESVEDIKTFLQASQSQQNYGYYGGFGSVRSLGADVAMMAVEESAGASAAPSSAKVAGGGASEYSTTNIQVEGVDEADFVKNDGRYIYVISNNQLVIVDAFPADNAEIVSETKFKGNAFELFVNDDRLVVFVEDRDETFVLPEYSIVPMPRYSPRTHVYVYDISDREDPELVKDYNVNGRYFDSRMIGNFVYFIAKEDVYFYGGVIDMPVIRAGSERIISPDVFYFDNPERNYIFHTIAAFDVTSNSDDIEAQSYMMGYSNNLYVSENNIYITYQKNLPYSYYQDHNEDRFYDVVVPLLPSEAGASIVKIKSNDDIDRFEKWEEISGVLEDMYNGMTEKEKSRLIRDIQEELEVYELKLRLERMKTVIHKIEIGDGEIGYDSKGEVPGTVLNQFSMDENDGYFRIATTLQAWGRGESILYNNVYVLDEDMEMVGELEDIAPDERIYSTRFLGDRLYMVTFKRIDPFFVIDLSDPRDPEILGELKIPGFSDYLHPFDENYIIGVGKETESNQWGGVSTGGVKLALFDVSDVENPKQIDKYEIGEAGTDSEALRDHKAFLFDREKELLVIPVREVTGRYKDPSYGYYRNNIWQGAYVFHLDESGFDLQGKVTHADNEDDRYYYNSPSAVRRALYMDDVLYTISSSLIKMNDLSDLDDINEVELPEQRGYDDYPKPIPMPRMVGGVVIGMPAVESVAVEVDVEE